MEETDAVLSVDLSDSCILCSTCKRTEIDLAILQSCCLKLQCFDCSFLPDMNEGMNCLCCKKLTPLPDKSVTQLLMNKWTKWNFWSNPHGATTIVFICSKCKKPLEIDRVASYGCSCTNFTCISCCMKDMLTIQADPLTYGAICTICNCSSKDDTFDDFKDTIIKLNDLMKSYDLEARRLTRSRSRQSPYILENVLKLCYKYYWQTSYSKHRYLTEQEYIAKLKHLDLQRAQFLLLSFYIKAENIDCVMFGFKTNPVVDEVLGLGEDGADEGDGADAAADADFAGEEDGAVDAADADGGAVEQQHYRKRPKL